VGHSNKLGTLQKKSKIVYDSSKRAVTYCNMVEWSWWDSSLI